jgi:hypothetical protein
VYINSLWVDWRLGDKKDAPDQVGVKTTSGRWGVQPLEASMANITLHLLFCTAALGEGLVGSLSHWFKSLSQTKPCMHIWIIKEKINK